MAGGDCTICDGGVLHYGFILLEAPLTLEQLTAKMAKWGVLWNDEAELYLKLIRASHKASRPKQGHKSGVENKGVTVVQNAPKPI